MEPTARRRGLGPLKAGRMIRAVVVAVVIYAAALAVAAVIILFGPDVTDGAFEL